MIDAFLRGELSREEAKQFEIAFLDTPRRKQQVAIARALRDSCAVREAPARSLLASRLAALLNFSGPMDVSVYATATAVALAGVVVWVAATARHAESLAQSAHQQVNSVNAHLESMRQELARANARLNEQAATGVRAAASSVSFVLLPGGVRGQGESKTISIPATAQSGPFELQSTERRTPGT